MLSILGTNLILTYRCSLGGLSADQVSKFGHRDPIHFTGHFKQLTKNSDSITDLIVFQPVYISKTKPFGRAIVFYAKAPGVLAVAALKPRQDSHTVLTPPVTPHKSKSKSSALSLSTPATPLRSTGSSRKRGMSMSDNECLERSRTDEETLLVAGDSELP